MKRWRLICTLHLSHLTRFDNNVVKRNVIANINEFPSSTGEDDNHNNVNINNVNINNCNTNTAYDNKCISHNTKNSTWQETDLTNRQQKTLEITPHEHFSKQYKESRKEMHIKEKKAVDELMKDLLPLVQLQRPLNHTTSLYSHNTTSIKASIKENSSSTYKSNTKYRSKREVSASLLDMNKLIRSKENRTWDTNNVNNNDRKQRNASFTKLHSLPITPLKPSYTNSSQMSEYQQLELSPWGFASTIALSTEIKKNCDVSHFNSYSVNNNNSNNSYENDCVNVENDRKKSLQNSEFDYTTTLEEYEEMLFTQQPANENILGLPKHEVDSALSVNCKNKDDNENCLTGSSDNDSDSNNKHKTRHYNSTVLVDDVNWSNNSNESLEHENSCSSTHSNDGNNGNSSSEVEMSTNYANNNNNNNINSSSSSNNNTKTSTNKFVHVTVHKDAESSTDDIVEQTLEDHGKVGNNCENKDKELLQQSIQNDKFYLNAKQKAEIKEEFTVNNVHKSDLHEQLTVRNVYRRTDQERNEEQCSSQRKKHVINLLRLIECKETSSIAIGIREEVTNFDNSKLTLSSYSLFNLIDELLDLLHQIKNKRSISPLETITTTSSALTSRKQLISPVNIILLTNRSSNSDEDRKCKFITTAVDMFFTSSIYSDFYYMEEAESKLRLMKHKERLFSIIQEMKDDGFHFIAEIAGERYFTDFAAELVLCCEKICIKSNDAYTLTVAFPGIQFGVLPSPSTINRAICHLEKQSKPSLNIEYWLSHYINKFRQMWPSCDVVYSTIQKQLVQSLNKWYPYTLRTFFTNVSLVKPLIIKMKLFLSTSLLSSFLRVLNERKERKQCKHDFPIQVARILELLHVLEDKEEQRQLSKCLLPYEEQENYKQVEFDKTWHSLSTENIHYCSFQQKIMYILSYLCRQYKSMFSRASKLYHEQNNVGSGDMNFLISQCSPCDVNKSKLCISREKWESYCISCATCYSCLKKAESRKGFAIPNITCTNSWNEISQQYIAMASLESVQNICCWYRHIAEQHKNIIATEHNTSNKSQIQSPLINYCQIDVYLKDIAESSVDELVDKIVLQLSVCEHSTEATTPSTMESTLQKHNVKQLLLQQAGKASFSPSPFEYYFREQHYFILLVINDDVDDGLCADLLATLRIACAEHKLTSSQYATINRILICRRTKNKLSSQQEKVEAECRHHLYHTVDPMSCWPCVGVLTPIWQLCPKEWLNGVSYCELYTTRKSTNAIATKTTTTRIVEHKDKFEPYLMSKNTTEQGLQTSNTYSVVQKNNKTLINIDDMQEGQSNETNNYDTSCQFNVNEDVLLSNEANNGKRAFHDKSISVSNYAECVQHVSEIYAKENGICFCTTSTGEVSDKLLASFVVEAAAVCKNCSMFVKYNVLRTFERLFMCHSNFVTTLFSDNEVSHSICTCILKVVKRHFSLLLSSKCLALREVEQFMEQMIFTCSSRSVTFSIDKSTDESNAAHNTEIAQHEASLHSRYREANELDKYYCSDLHNLLAYRIFIGLLKYCLHALYSREVMCASDINTISTLTLGLHPSTGGLLSIADNKEHNNTIAKMLEVNLEEVIVQESNEVACAQKINISSESTVTKNETSKFDRKCDNVNEDANKLLTFMHKRELRFSELNREVLSEVWQSLNECEQHIETCLKEELPSNTCDEPETCFR